MAIAVATFALLPPGAGSASAEGAVRLVWCDLYGLAVGSESAAREEAAALVARMGATLSWRIGQPGEVRRRDEVWVVLVGEGPRSSRLVLGTTLRNPRVAPLVWVRVPHVQAALGSRGRPSQDPRRLGIAVGRVIAHELVHALVPSQPHGSGLMSETFSARQLDAVTMPIEHGVALAFGAALRDGPVASPAGTVVAASFVPADGSCPCPPASLR